MKPFSAAHSIRLLAPALVSSTLLVFGCSASDGNTSAGGGATTGVGTGGTSSSGGSTGAGNSLVFSGGTGNGKPSDDRDLPVRTKQCDASGQNCTCLKLALVGSLNSGADAADTKPFTDWLNGNSGGTAQVTMVSTKPTIDDAWLANYDILLVGNVNGWILSQAEKDAINKWQMESGGGIISLTGFESTNNEPADSGQFIAHTGISYAGLPWTAPDGGTQPPVPYHDGTQDLRECLVWNPNVGNPQITTPIKFAPQTGEMGKITANLWSIGAYIGWGVVAPTDATVLATDPKTSQVMAAAKELSGKGRVLAFGDEWVLLANQWGPSASAVPNNQQKDQYNKCYVAATADAAEFFHSAATLYQSKQFWYNAISYVAPPNECFVIEDKDVIIIK